MLMKLNGKILTIALLFAGVNIIPAPSALDIVNVVAIAKGIKVNLSGAAGAAGAPVITPGKTVVAPNVASPIIQLWMAPLWTNAPGNTGTPFAECIVLAPLLSAINSALAQGVSVSVCPVFAASSTKTGYQDLIITAYNQSTQQVIGSPQVCPGIMQNNNTWKYSNVTYQLNTAGSTTVGVGGVAINQAFGITSSAVSSKNITPVTPPTNLFTNPNPPLQAGQKITSFMVGPNFADKSYANVTIDETSLSVEGPACLSLIPVNTPIAFAFQTVANSVTGGFDTTITGYVYGSSVPLFTYFEPSIINKSSNGSAGMISSVKTTYIDSWYHYKVSGDATDHYGQMPASTNGFYFPATLATATLATATPAAVTPAPYPTNNIFATPVTLQVAQILTELNYYLGFADGSLTALMINSSGPAASFLTAVNASIAQGNAVVFTAAATANGTGYDAVASAYVLNTITPIATYSFPSITNWGTSASGHTNTNVAILNANNSIKNHWVKYVTANPPYATGYLPIYPSAGYQIQSTATGNADITTSEHGNYQDFLNTLNNSPIMISSGLQVDKNIVVAVSPSAGQYQPTEITLGGYTLFGPNSTFSASLLAPYLANVNWTNPSEGVIFVLIEFDSAGNSIADLTKAATTDSIYLFLFDFLTGDSLTTAGIPVPTSSAPFKPLTNPFNATGENGFINVDATYPATFVLQLANSENQQNDGW
jgi:hypothetical protein